jgi:hypothetical protein
MNNTYGTVRSANIDPSSDVDIWYNFRPKRNTSDSQYSKFIKVTDVNSMLSKAEVEDAEDNNNSELNLMGMYNLTLPVSIFNQVGYYTIYIKPKEIYCSIQDVGVLAAYPDVNGIVLDTQTDTTLEYVCKNNGLCGYRVEYFSTSDGKKTRENFYRIVTSSNMCAPVSQNLTTSTANSVGYRYSDGGTLCFLTLTPSVAPSFKTNSIPYIGTVNQNIALINTKFDPICIEIEMCKNDFDTLTTYIAGNQIRSLDNGLLTTYNDDGEVFAQFEFFTVKDNYNENTVKEVKKKKDDISYDDNYNDIINS